MPVTFSKPLSDLDVQKELRRTAKATQQLVRGSVLVVRYAEDCEHVAICADPAHQAELSDILRVVADALPAHFENAQDGES